jgi:hypothetical protein
MGDLLVQGWQAIIGSLPAHTFRNGSALARWCGWGKAQTQTVRLGD